MTAPALKATFSPSFSDCFAAKVVLAEALVAVNAALGAEGLAPGEMALLTAAKVVATLRSDPNSTEFAAKLIEEALEGLPEDAPERPGLEVLGNRNVLQMFAE